MKVIDRYLVVHTLWGILLVLSFLIILVSLMELLMQVNQLGKGDYGMQDAFAYIALTIPKRMVELIPVSILLGSIISLGMLSDRNELTAMQASGISPLRICGSVLFLGAGFVLITFFIAEYIAPTFDQQARIRRSKAIYAERIKITKSGFWARHGEAFIHVKKTIAGGTAAELDIFQLDAQGRLHSYIHARQAVISENGTWLLFDTEEKIFTDQGITSARKKHRSLKSFLSAQQVAILELPADSLSLSDLFHYIQGLKQRGQNAERYALAFWQKMSWPFASLAMILISLTFIFGHVREISSGTRILLACMVGVGIYLLNHIIGSLGVLLNLHPASVTMLPILIIAIVSIALLRRLQGKRGDTGGAKNS
jgi:lipopolysaccharide export system permease protein